MLTHDRWLLARIRTATLDDMEDRDARPVEITLALILGIVVAVLPMVALWVAGRRHGFRGGPRIVAVITGSATRHSRTGDPVEG